MIYVAVTCRGRGDHQKESAHTSSIYLPLACCKKIRALQFVHVYALTCEQQKRKIIWSFYSTYLSSHFNHEFRSLNMEELLIGQINKLTASVIVMQMQINKLTSSVLVMQINKLTASVMTSKSCYSRQE